MFDRAQTALVQFVTSLEDTTKVRQAAASYCVPLGPIGGPLGHSVTVYGAYSESAADAGSDLFSLAGKGLVIGALYGLPLPRLGAWRQGLQFGAEFQKVEDALGFGGTTLDNVVRTLPLILRWQADGRDAGGQTGLLAGVAWQRDGLLRDFSGNAYAASRAGADTDWLIWTLGASRTQFLGKGWSAAVSAEADVSPDRLLPSQQPALGGYDTVRGYRRRAVIADRAVRVRTELRTPPMSSLLPAALESQTQFLAFLDYGHAANNSPAAGELDGEDLLGAGLGVRMALLKQALTGRLDVGWALSDIESTPRDERGQCIVDFGVECRY